MKGVQSSCRAAAGGFSGIPANYTSASPCGDNLTLADIPAGTSLYRYFEIDVERPSVPHVEASYRRLQERSADREQIMVPFGELYGRLDY
jgi:glutathione S-transferase